MEITATKTLQLYYITPLISLHANELGDNSQRGLPRGRRVEGWQQGPHAASVAHKIEQNTCKVRQRQPTATETEKARAENELESDQERRGSSYSMTPLLTPLQLSGMLACLYVQYICTCVCVRRWACAFVDVMEKADTRIGKSLGGERFSWQDSVLRVYYLILFTSCVEIRSHKSMKRLAQVYN